MPLLVAVLLLALAAPTAHAGYREREVREAVRAAGFPKLADRAAEASRVALVIRRTRLKRTPSALGTTRFGGVPDLPPREPWPQCAGRPQTFLGQLRVRDLPRPARSLRQLGGTVLFFTHVEFEDPSDTTEVGIGAGRCSTVLHARAGTPLRRARRLPSPTMRLRPARMRFTPRPSIPSETSHGWMSPPMRDVTVPGDSMSWFDLRERLLGDPSGPEHRALGHLSQVNGETGRCWWRTQRRRGAWLPLFTMSYDVPIGFEVADGGRLQIVVAPGDLRRGRFDRVCGIFESA